MFLAHNAALVPPYRVLIDTNFINFSLQNKLELISGMMDCLYAKCMSQILKITDVMPIQLAQAFRVLLTASWLSWRNSATDIVLLFGEFKPFWALLIFLISSFFLPKRRPRSSL